MISRNLFKVIDSMLGIDKERDIEINIYKAVVVDLCHTLLALLYKSLN